MNLRSIFCLKTFSPFFAVLLGFSGFAFSNEICSRTPEVRQAIESAVGKSCDQINTQDLHSVQSISIRGASNLELKANDFGELAGLETLELDGNQITSLPEALFSGLRSLQDLFLSDNQISTLSPLLFKDLAALQMLDLSGNKISKLPNYVFFGLGQLSYLNLNANQLEIVGPQVFDSISFHSRANVYISKGNPLTEETKDLLFSQLLFRYR